MNDQPTTPSPSQQPSQQPSQPPSQPNPFFGHPAPQGPPPEGPPPAAQTAPLPVQRRPRRAGLAAAAVVATAVVVGGAAGIGGAAAWTALDDGSPSTSSSPTTTSQVVDTPQSAAPNGSVENVATKVLPSVVKIDVSGPQGAGSGSGIILSSDGE